LAAHTKHLIGQFCAVYIQNRNAELSTMSSQQFDSSDSLIAFASETATGLTQDTEPAFRSTPTLGDAPHSIFSLDHRQPPKFRIWPITTFSVVIGILVGFAAGYAFAHRVATPATESASIPVSSGNSQTTRAESTESVNGPNVPAPALTSGASAISVPSTPSSTTGESRISNPESRVSTAARRRPAVVSTTGKKGMIEVLSHPQGAQVLLDGNVVGRTPLAIADVPEGTHEVRLEITGFHRWVTSVHVSEGGRARVGASLEP
jgi:PEGA domain